MEWVAYGLSVIGAFVLGYAWGHFRYKNRTAILEAHREYSRGFAEGRQIGRDQMKLDLEEPAAKQHSKRATSLHALLAAKGARSRL